jgi:hypothetical protein
MFKVSGRPLVHLSHCLLFTKPSCLLFSVFICHLTFIYSSLSLHTCFRQALLCIYLSVSQPPASLQPTDICLFFFQLTSSHPVKLPILYLCFSVGFTFVICLLYLPASYSSATLAAYLVTVSCPDILLISPVSPFFCLQISLTIWADIQRWGSILVWIVILSV